MGMRDIVDVDGYPTPMEKTFHVIGKGPFTLQQGIDETVGWLRLRKGTGI